MHRGAPRILADVDLFAPGAQEHWYQAYAILHAEAPVQRLPGEGLTPGSDAFVLTKYADIARVVKDWERFPPTLSLLVAQIQASGEMPTHIPAIDAMIASIVSLRPTPALWRAHRKELTDPCGMIVAADFVDGEVDAARAHFLHHRGHETHDCLAAPVLPPDRVFQKGVLGEEIDQPGIVAPILDTPELLDHALCFAGHWASPLNGLALCATAAAHPPPAKMARVP